MGKRMSVGRLERFGWTLFFLIGFLVCLYVSANFSSLTERYGTIAVISIPIAVASLINWAGQDLFERMRKFPTRRDADLGSAHGSTDREEPEQLNE